MTYTNVEEGLRAILGFTKNSYSITNENAQNLERFATTNNLSLLDILSHIVVVGIFKSFNDHTSKRQLTQLMFPRIVLI